MTTKHLASTWLMQPQYSIVVDGFEDSPLRCKPSPWPSNAPRGAVETAGATGASQWQVQAPTVTGKGAIAIHEPAANSADPLLLEILTRCGQFDATLYQGMPDAFVCAKRIHGAFLVLNDASLAERDWHNPHNRVHRLIISGMLHYHYFGEVITHEQKG